MGPIAWAIYNLGVLGGTAWLVCHGWSAWWFLLAFGLLADYSRKDDA